ncbi:17537_t:CDS:2 [Funneliformis geosporum]|nr:17537_t:CDS:2 [Funneliformis geosporum]
MATTSEVVASRIAYSASDLIYVIEPNSPKSSSSKSQSTLELTQYQTQSKTNIFNKIPELETLHSISDPFSKLHVQLSKGSLISVIIPSNCSKNVLINSIPHLYKISNGNKNNQGGVIVIHVALDKSDLNQLGDYTDVMALRQTGFALLHSSGPQESSDMALIAHSIALKTGISVIHFFDNESKNESKKGGKIKILGNNDIKKLIVESDVQKYRDTLPNDLYFRSYNGISSSADSSDDQQDVSNANGEISVPTTTNGKQQSSPADFFTITEDIFETFKQLTNRSYKIIEFFGDKRSDSIIITMGSGAVLLQKVFEKPETSKIDKRKKDIGLYAMNYGNVFVASVAMYSSYTQVLHALIEAEKFKGPSIVLAYLPYHSEKDTTITVLKETKLAVDNGYWPLYRWNPELEKAGKEPFILDSERIKQELQSFLDRENHLTQLIRSRPDYSPLLTNSLESEVKSRQKSLAKSAYEKLLGGLTGPPLLILFGSDNGNAEGLARRLQKGAIARGINARCLAMDDFPIEDITLEKNLVFICSTAGQGEFPQNARDFWKHISTTTDISFTESRYTVFGLGDSHYWPREEDAIYYNKPGKDLDARLELLGGQSLVPLGLGDDQDADGYETAYQAWEPELWKALGVELLVQQWLAMDEIAEKYGSGSLKLTTRQAFQLHGVLKRNLREAIRGINRCLLDTLAACGDVNRNVMCNPNPLISEVHAEVQDFAMKISAHLSPRTSAYHEIWLDDKMVAGQAVQDFEPLYGHTYLPRKFKIAIAMPPNNDVDVFAHDLGYIVISDDNGKLLGYNVTVGGGMGMTHNNKKTYPNLGQLLGFSRPDQAIEVGEKVMLVQRDFGDRINRKHARLKYTIDDRDLDWFRNEVESRLGYKLDPPKEYKFENNADRYGWTKGVDDKWHFCMYIENGRVVDSPGEAIKTGLREIAKVHKGDFRLTPNQHLILGNVSEQDKPQIEELLKKYKLDNLKFTGLRLNSMSCVALPTCGLAMAESERYLPTLVSKLEIIIEECGLRGDAITIRMTGCPNGCARPYVAEIACVGKALGTYNLYLGGGFYGQRLNKLYKESLKEEDILGELKPMLSRYAKERNDGERFGDFVIRMGYVKATNYGKDFHDL